MEEDEMGRTCGMYSGEEKYIQHFGRRNIKEKGHLKDKGTDGRIILKWILRKLDGKMLT
jgi:hypothetical protein